MKIDVYRIIVAYALFLCGSQESDTYRQNDKLKFEIPFVVCYNIKKVVVLWFEPIII